MALLSLLPEYRSLVRLGIPVLVTQLCVITVSFADTLMVGSYGLDELAASAFVNSVMLVPIVMLIGFAGGVTPLIGALYSQKNDFRIGHTFRASLKLNSALAAVFTLIMGTGYFFLDKMGQEPELLPLIRPYYLEILATMIPAALFNCCQQTANGTTDTATPMWVILGVNALNILGNYLLIFGHWGFPELGLRGAGLSTLISRIAGVIAIYLLLYYRPRYRRYREGLRSRASCREEIRRLWHTSYPVMLQSGIECLLWTVGAVVSGWFGKVQLAAYQIINTIGQLGFMIYMSIGVAVSVRVANFTGLGDVAGIRRITRAGLHILLLMATLASVLFLSCTAGMISLFNDTEAVIVSGSALVVPLVLYQYCDAVQLCYANAQRGTSFARPLMWAAIISYVVVGIPVLMLFAVGFDLGNVGVYYSFSVALLSAAVLLRYWYSQTLRRLERPEGAQFKTL